MLVLRYEPAKCGLNFTVAQGNTPFSHRGTVRGLRCRSGA